MSMTDQTGQESEPATAARSMSAESDVLICGSRIGPPDGATESAANHAGQPALARKWGVVEHLIDDMPDDAVESVRMSAGVRCLESLPDGWAAVDEPVSIVQTAVVRTTYIDVSGEEALMPARAVYTTVHAVAAGLVSGLVGQDGKDQT